MGNNITDRKSGLRKFLVIFQLVISLLLLVGTVVIHEQLNFMQHKKLGYDKSHVLILFTGYRGFDHEGFANALRSETGIISLTGSASLPSAIESNEYIDTPDRKQHWVYYNSIDKDFFSTLEINLIAGKDRVSNLLPEQYPNKYVLNEAALREIGWKPEEAIGQEISIRHGNMEPGPVIGVIEDFHFQSLHFPIRPLVLEFVPENLNHLLVRIPGDHIQATIGRIKAQWKKFAGDIPFEYSFLDNEYDNLYKSETKTGKLFVVFAALSSLISMLGLFGLSSYTALKRSREIGIRKVFGASAFSIIRMFSGEFASLVLFSFVISAPLAWIFMTLWLKEFAYKVEINPVLLLMAGGLVMVLTLLTVGFHSIRAAHTNPVTTLKYE